jgi:hypothetical protein
MYYIQQIYVCKVIENLYLAYQKDADDYAEGFRLWIS